MRLEPYLSPANTLILADQPSRDALLAALAAKAHETLPAIAIDRLARELIDREGRYPTSLPEGLAFPHAILEVIDQTFVIAAAARPPVSFGVKGHPPCDLVFGMFGNASQPWQHVRLMARLARITHGAGALNRLRDAADAAELYALLIAEDRKYG